MYISYQKDSSSDIPEYHFPESAGISAWEFPNSAPMEALLLAKDHRRVREDMRTAFGYHMGQLTAVDTDDLFLVMNQEAHFEAALLALLLLARAGGGAEDLDRTLALLSLEDDELLLAAGVQGLFILVMEPLLQFSEGRELELLDFAFRFAADPVRSMPVITALVDIFLFRESAKGRVMEALKARLPENLDDLADLSTEVLTYTVVLARCAGMNTVADHGQGLLAGDALQGIDVVEQLDFVNQLADLDSIRPWQKSPTLADLYQVRQQAQEMTFDMLQEEGDAIPEEPDGPVEIYQLKITLNGIKPAIHRTFWIEGYRRVDTLHDVIQEVMGWGNAHLYSFGIKRKGDRRPSVLIMFDEMGWGEEVIPPDTLTVAELFDTTDTVIYEYDFGDGWEHTVKLMRVLDPDPKITYPYVVRGARACPPEDCGGWPGYYTLLEGLEAKKTGKKLDYDMEGRLEWLGDLLGVYDPEAFDRKEINEYLAQDYGMQYPKA